MCVCVCVFVCVCMWVRVCVRNCSASTTNYKSAGALGLYISLVGFEHTTCCSQDHRSTITFFVICKINASDMSGFTYPLWGSNPQPIAQNTIALSTELRGLVLLIGCSYNFAANSPPHHCIGNAWWAMGNQTIVFVGFGEPCVPKTIVYITFGETRAFKPL